MNEKGILLVTSEFPPLPGGIGNHAYNLAVQLHNNSFNVEVIADQRGEIEEEARFDKTVKFKIHRVPIKNFRGLMYVKRLQLLFQLAKQADIIIATGKFSLWSVALASLFYKRKTIAVIHGTEVNFKNVLLKKSIDMALSRFSKIIAVSHYTKTLAKNLKREVLVIPNGIMPLKQELKTETKMELKGQPRLVTVGNVTERKGQLNVIRHLPKILNGYPELHYHCIGIPTEIERFKTIASNLGVKDHVTFHGRLNNEELQSILLASDVFVMLSGETETGDVEGFGIAILEANLLGIPAIGAKNCGIEDAINHNISGMLVNYDDTGAFVNALNNILKSKAEFSENARYWALEHSWQIIIDKYIKVIRGL